MGGGRSRVGRPADFGIGGNDRKLVFCDASSKNRSAISDRFAFAGDRGQRRGVNAYHQKKLRSYATQITGVALVDA
jgi:hypothetical protein